MSGALVLGPGNPACLPARVSHRAVKERLVAGLLRRPSPTTAAAAAIAAPVVSETTVAAAIVDADALLLAGKTTPAALFPPFFLVAVEAGSFARGLLLLELSARSFAS